MIALLALLALQQGPVTATRAGTLIDGTKRDGQVLGRSVAGVP